MMTNAQVDQTIKTYLSSANKFVNKIDTLIVSHPRTTYTYSVGLNGITSILQEWHDDCPGDGLQHRDFHLFTGDVDKPNDMRMIGTVSGAYVISVTYDTEVYHE